MGAPGTWTWRATGTTWIVHHDGGVDEALAGAASRLVEADEARWSRFRPTSDVARISAAAGTWAAVAPETALLLRAAEEARVASGGRFSPLLGAQLAAWGYVGAPGDAPPDRAPRPEPAVGGIELAGAAGRERARIPRGAAIDLGGIAKAWMAARVADLLAARADGDAIAVSAGGDVVAARGDQRIRIEPVAGHPGALEADVREGSGIATSGSGRRAWRLGDGTPAHHLLDPATGAPCAPVHVTVVADDLVSAEVAATIVAIEPAQAAMSREAVLVRFPDGRTACSQAWPSVVAQAVAS